MLDQIIKSFFVIVVLFAASAVNVKAGTNYDTSWTLVYDGGKKKDSSIIGDYFYDVKSLPDGGCVCTGESGDTSSPMGQIVLLKLDRVGKIVWKRLYKREYYQYARTLCVARNGDLIIGGVYQSAPLIVRTDSAGNVKWTTWYYDSTSRSPILLRRAVVNCLRETRRGTIICAAGDDYPDNNGQPLKNYAAFLELDSAGKIVNWGENSDIAGYNISGFDIEETKTGNYLLSGNQNVLYLDTAGNVLWQKKYTFSLTGVGTEVNNINKAKMLRDGSLMAMGQAYEGNCWTKYQHLYYDAWWSPISYAYGTNATWDTAGIQGGDDAIYDFTQLIDGKLAFIGKKYNTGSEIGGIWAFVTDSTGKNILWENQIKICYRTDDGRALTPLSVCATNDSGFSIAGKDICTDENGGTNAFVAHFIPKPPAGISSDKNTSPSQKSIAIRISRTKVWFSISRNGETPVEIVIFSASGRNIARLNGRAGVDSKETTFVWDRSRYVDGVYFYRTTLGGRVSSGKIITGN